MIPSLPRRSPAVLAGALVLGLAGCGGGDSKPKPKPPAPTPPPGLTEAQFNALPLSTQRAQVEQRFGPPLANPASRISKKYIEGEPKGFSCVYYPVSGGPREDFFRLCYKGGTLQSKLGVTTAKKPS